MRGVGKGEYEDKKREEQEEKNNKTRLKKILHSRTSRIKMKMKKKVEIGKEE